MVVYGGSNDGGLTVCVAHKQFVPCRACGESTIANWSRDPADVAAVYEHQRTGRLVTRDRSEAPRDLLWAPEGNPDSFDDPPSDALLRIQKALGINDPELADLFSIGADESYLISDWKAGGVPNGSRQAVIDVLAVVELLESKLRDGQLYVVAREPALRFHGATLLEALKADPAETRRIYEAAFDYSGGV